jgi:hypothetical protein
VAQRAPSAVTFPTHIEDSRLAYLMQFEEYNLILAMSDVCFCTVEHRRPSQSELIWQGVKDEDMRHVWPNQSSFCWQMEQWQIEQMALPAGVRFCMVRECMSRNNSGSWSGDCSREEEIEIA